MIIYLNFIKKIFIKYQMKIKIINKKIYICVPLEYLSFYRNYQIKIFQVIQITLKSKIILFFFYFTFRSNRISIEISNIKSEYFYGELKNIVCRK
jgi:hypothetical protein